MTDNKEPQAVTKRELYNALGRVLLVIISTIMMLVIVPRGLVYWVSVGILLYAYISFFGEFFKSKK